MFNRRKHSEYKGSGDGSMKFSTQLRTVGSAGGGSDNGNDGGENSQSSEINFGHKKSVSYTAPGGGFSGWINRVVLLEKFNNPAGYAILAGISLVMGLLVAFSALEIGVVLEAAIIGLPIVAAMLINLEFGVLFIVGMSFFLMGIKKAIDVPFGLFLDVGILLLFFGMFVHQMGKREWSFLKNPVTYIILLWISYNVLEIANPNAESRMAWFYTVRGMAGTIVLYFIIIYCMDNFAFAKKLIRLVIGLSLLAALYGIWQEYLGLAPWEKKWLHSDISNYKLIYQWGRIRIFSFMSDPTTFGILMAYMAVFCFILATGPFRMIRRVQLVVAGALMILSMSYSGTRTAFALIPLGVVFFALLSMRKVIIGMALVFMMGGTVLMMLPTSNATLYRVQSTFKPGQDRSMQVRLKNQAFIQPYIQTHPIGGGLGSTGAWGKRFSPHSMLAQFPPDSGYVRVAVELGWIGLLIYCVMMFTILQQGIKHYIRVRDPIIKIIYAALLSVLFSLAIVNYTQEALILLPNSVVFFVLIALIVRLKDFDPGYKGKATA